MARTRETLNWWIFDEQGDLIDSDQDWTGQIEDLPSPLPDLFAKSLASRKVVQKTETAEMGAVRISGGERTAVLVYKVQLGKFTKKIKELETKNLELEAFFESSHDGVVMADGQGTLIKINDNYTKVTGISRDQLIGQNVFELEKKKVFSPSGTIQVLEARRTVTLEQTFSSGRQSVITSSPVFNADGKIIRVVTNVRDMTEVNNLRRELDSTISRLDEASRKMAELSKQFTSLGEDTFATPSLVRLYEKAAKFAHFDAPLLITGASGVGKEVLANFVHKNSERSKKPFIKINCGAIPENLLESELFGYEDGAFTGARRSGRIGLFETANGGSILLDEVGDLPLNLQVKLLRFVQHKEFYRVGGVTPRSVDVRIIAATNRDLEKMVKEESFRMDLYYRLNILQIHIPNLAERREDIIPLAHFFLKKYNNKYKMKKTISPEVYAQLERHPWVGNIREMENIIESLVIVSTGAEIKPEHLPLIMLENNQIELVEMPSNYREALHQFERQFWQNALRRYGSCRQAALHMGLDPSTVSKKVARYRVPLNNNLKKFGE